MQLRFKHFLISILFILAFILITKWDGIKKRQELKRGLIEKSEGDKINGLKHGKWVTYYENGQIAIIEYYKDDTLNGSSVSYDSDGLLSSEATYHMGIQIDTFKMYSRGELNLVQYRDSTGDRQGRFTVFSNGMIIQIGHSKDNKYHGEFKTYYDKGMIKEQYHYTNGEKSGEWIKFDKLGDTIEVKNYCN